jgi:hypothetical protein
MKIASAVETTKPAGWACVAAACMIVAMPAWAQDGADQRSGVSRPSSAPISVDATDPSVPVATAPAKPSAAIPSTPPTTYGPYVPYRPADGVDSSAATASSPAQSFDPDANIVTTATAGQADRRLLAGPVSSGGKIDEDAGIVTYVPSRPGEISEGSLVRVRLHEEISTLTTRPGTKFTAVVSEPVMHDGQVVVPAGSILEGRVTWVRGGKRLGGPAAIHLEPRNVTLPDGAQYMLRARVIDTDSWENTKVDSEGTITRSENKKRNLGVMSLTTGGGLAAGALIAGPAGAIVGAGVGAGVSTVVWLKQDRQAELPKDLQLIFSLTEPMSITPATAALTPEKPVLVGGE